ncbi:hypothetical protein [Paraferrimonas haliotis]|uniref:Lipoprotein n=1 Tax=Paraferrimonas haliotis TaxID=2013866 RepID=A0AA37TRJ1_9GAMM|nr:hypothetical protein [Paraferrimonas haliotis]GLS83022.1 lipoprotein [Paraferrimonas haliotis]
MNIRCYLTFTLISLSSFSVVANTDETNEPDSNARANIYDDEAKDSQDPTRINTKLGVAIDHNFQSSKSGYSVSGSIGLSEAQKVNMRFHPDTGEWKLGGSWLFDFGIVNFNFGKSEYDDGANYNNYSVGTFVPLSVFGFEPGGWQIFPMAGFNYTDGERPLGEWEPDFDPDNPYVLHPTNSTGGYIGAFSLKPVHEKVTVMAFAGASKGSNDYSGYWLGAGSAFKLTKRDSLSLLAIYSDNDYGTDKKLVLSYSHDFSLIN